MTVGATLVSPLQKNTEVIHIAQCHDSAPGHDGLPYSAFKPDLPWWRGLLLQFFNLVLHNTVPAAWKISTVVPVFKHGDPASPDQYRPISLASCAFKIFERLICTRIAPHISERLNGGQGGFRWGADTMVYSLVDAFRLRRETHTFCAFVDIRKAFDTCWVEATLVRLFQVGVTGGMWRTIACFLCGTLSQVRTGSDVSHPWVDYGIAQGRVLSPLLFNLLVNSLAATISRSSPGVRLSSCSDFRLSNQLYVDDLVILQESAADLQAALDAVSHWGQQWRFSFGIGPEKSAVVIFGPPRHALFCLSSLPIATSEWSSLPHFRGAIMSIIWWTAGADCLRSVCLGFDQRACQSLSRSSSSQRMCSQALLSVSNSRANAPVVSPDLIALFASGVVTCLAGQVAHPMRRCSASLVFTMACASPLVGLWLSMLVSLPSRSAPVLLSQPQSSLSPNPPLAVGHTGVAQ